eukprot:gene3000-19955_t
MSHPSIGAVVAGDGLQRHDSVPSSWGSLLAQPPPGGGVWQPGPHSPHRRGGTLARRGWAHPGGGSR